MAFDPLGGYLYLTEDNFGFPSGFYRYKPPSDPVRTGRLDDGGNPGIQVAHRSAS